MNKLKIIKRNKEQVDYNASKISTAVNLAAIKIGYSLNDGIGTQVENKIFQILEGLNKTRFTVDEIGALVEQELFNLKYPDIAQEYFQYRISRQLTRDKHKKYNLLSQEFLSSYKHLPNPMSEMGRLVFYRTYSRYLPEEGRREYWWETVARAVDYNCSLVPNISKKEAELLYDNIFNLRQFLSGRTFWVGGTEVAEKYPMANYNCAFTILDNYNAFKELFYALMIGSGVGLRVLKEDVEKLAPIRTDYMLIHEYHIPVPKKERKEHTGLSFIHDDIAVIEVGDSKEGWTESLELYFRLLTSKQFKEIKTIRINYNSVRPKGEPLKTFGGTASGHQSLVNMFRKFDSVITKRGRGFVKLKPIDCLDFANIIGENVVVGGKLVPPTLKNTL